MVDTAKAASSVPGEAAEQALAFLGRDVAGPARRGDPRRRRRGARRQRRAASAGARTSPPCSTVADRAGDEPVEQVHIATEQGEVFAIRHAGLAAVAVTERFALASLLFFDMRSILRDLRRRRQRRRSR